MGSVKTPKVFFCLNRSKTVHILFIFSLSLNCFYRYFIFGYLTVLNNKQILGSIGTIGGAWGLATALYAILFGNQFYLILFNSFFISIHFIQLILNYFKLGFDSIKPWGLIQSCCCRISKTSKNELRRSLPIIPFVSRKDSFNDSYDHKNIENDNNNNSVTREEFESLLIYLKDYVVDVSSLESLAKRAA
jgi:hypothetical protein